MSVPGGVCEEGVAADGDHSKCLHFTGGYESEIPHMTMADAQDIISKLEIAHAQRACAAWWGSFGGSENPEGEWEGLDVIEQDYWRDIARAVLYHQ